MTLEESKPVIEKDSLITIREAEADRHFYLRAELNREMMRLSAKERRRRWTEYLVRLDDLMIRSRPLKVDGEVRCGSCFKGAGEVLAMFEGPNTFICNECVMLFAEEVAERGDGAPGYSNALATEDKDPQ